MRKIVIGGQLYFWKFRGVREDVSKSNLTVISENKETKYIVHFTTIDTYTAGNPLNEGLPMEKDGEKYLINLNQPKYVAEILQYIMDHRIEEPIVKKTYNFNGNEILLSMGYQDLEHFLI